MKDFFHIVMTGVATGLVAFVGFLPTVRAETIITDGFLQGDTVWAKEHSPYILNDTVTVSQGMTLTIEPGVEVRADPAASYDPYIYVAGSLVAHGNEQQPIRIGNIWGVTVDHGSADISEAIFAMKGSLTFTGSVGRISTTTISNTVEGTISDGVYIQNSAVVIEGSKIEGNANGIMIQDAGGIFQVRGGSFLGNLFEKTGLIRTAHAAEPVPSSVSIVGSRLMGNSQSSIHNKTLGEVQAGHNWWGSAHGPEQGVIGPVAYTPWLDRDPFDSSVAACCSSILFLPGLEGSRLYRDESGFMGMGTTSNRLWEPNRNDDVRKLFLHPDGSSIDSAIYAGGPLSKALGVVDIYGSFMDFLDGLSQKGTIAEWRSFGYDWRLPVQEVVTGQTRRATTTESLVETLEQMASRSKTGKVTLIAHSNGGLVTKYLVKTLADMGKETLVDSVISVAVPYLGTPQAILGLLHGDNQAIFGGLILKASVAKELGTNMSSAYTLLPSATYFTKMFGPTIAYAASSTPAADSALQQDSFINSRANSALMDAARVFHSIIDPFSWPASIARWAIVGWGNKTAKGIVYSSLNGTKYTATTTSLGDGTVVAPSAAYNAGTTTAIDLVEVSVTNNKDIDHSNILSAAETQKTIESIVTSTTRADSKHIEETISSIGGVTIGEPDYTKEKTYLVVSTHSPVELHLYDAQGNHTGIAPLSKDTDEDIEDGLFTYVEKNVRGSSFEIYGDEDQPEMYISVPDTAGQTYSVGIQGTGVGEFTYKVERVRGGEVLDSVVYSSLPVTPLMAASTTVMTQITGATIPTKLASSSPALKIDIDGNGSVDVIAKANTTLDPIVYLESLKKIIAQLIGSNTRAKNLNKRIARLEELVKKGKFKKIRNNAEKFKKSISHKKTKLLSVAEKDQIIGQIDLFLAQFE